MSAIERAPVPRMLYTIDEAVEATGLSRRTLERCIADGRLRVVRKFGRPMIPASELTEELERPALRSRRRESQPIAP